MSTTTTSTDGGATKDSVAASDFAHDSTSATTMLDSLKGYVARVRGGDMGSLPAILGLAVLMVVFGLSNDRFFSLLNMANLVVQAGPIVLLAMGLVFVLLIGQIDLSAGVAGGVAAAATALTVANQGWPWYAAVALGILTSEEWRLSAWRSAPNTVRIVSPEWSAWLRMRDRKRAGADHPRQAEQGKPRHDRAEQPHSHRRGSGYAGDTVRRYQAGGGQGTTDGDMPTAMPIVSRRLGCGVGR